MNRVKMLLILAGLATAIAVQPAVAQSSSPTQQDPASPSSATQSTPQSASPSMIGGMESQTFTGKVTKSGSKYVLKDDATRTSYTLDDQERAKQFEGKTVKVNGKLDAASNTIVVASIEPGS